MTRPCVENYRAERCVLVGGRRVALSGDVGQRTRACYVRSVTLVVDIRHWLDEDGAVPTNDRRLRRRVLRVAQFIEYGGTLAVGESRETLIECKRRPGRVQCLGLLWVTKAIDDRVAAHCLVCGEDEAIISGWNDTIWASGVMEPAPADDTSLH